VADVIIIRHKFTANTVTTSVKMPGKPPILKRWKRKRGGGFSGDFLQFWDEEDLPSEVATAASNVGTGVCGVLKR
jgi:hypothetical protein